MVQNREQGPAGTASHLKIMEKDILAVKENKQKTDSDKVWMIVGIIFAVVLYSCIAFFSYGYDDEYWNIYHIEDASSLTAMVQSTVDTDTHPPLSYIINYLLFQVLKSWSMVRVVGAVLCAVSVCLVWHNLYHREDRVWKIYSYIMVCLNPTLLLWCTSLRWYTYMVISVCALELLLVHREKLKKPLFWGLLFLIYVIMFHLEYSAAILIVVSFILIVLATKAVREELPFILLFGIAAVISVVPQAYIFITVKYPFGKSIGEIYSPLRCILGAGQNLLCGQGAFPISPAGIILGIGNIMLCFVLLGNMKSILGQKKHIFFFCAYVLVTILGIGGKIRNYTPLALRQSDLFVELAKEAKHKWFQRISMALILVGSIWSAVNVLAHTDTNKGGWNMPYAEIVAYVSEQYDADTTVVWTHDPVLSYSLQDKGYHTIGEEPGWEADMEKAKSSGKTVVIASTYKGSLDEASYVAISTYIDDPKFVPGRSFGKDNYAWLKRKMDSEYPDYYCELYIWEK